jgi:hypothetical protein
LLEVLKPLLFNTALISTASAGINPVKTTPIGITLIIAIPGNIISNGIGSTKINIDPYKLNKVNIGKLGFIKNREIIIGHKFKYFKKSNKKG